MYFDAVVSQKPCIDFVQNYADGNGRGLYIVGGVGAGKTYEASAIASSFLWSGYSVIMCTSLSMLDQIYANQHGQQTRGTDDFCRADLLIVDDLGKENANQWAVTTLFQVVDSRYANLKPTVFTSQYPLQGLLTRMSRSGERESAEAIVSRIAGTCDVVELRNGDRRKRSPRK
jgi:DNA replication protein DnaC/primosomal protein DnaI